ncbi:MAG: hypothetical protein MdMp014T_2928 [Treponematales bacterium]
MKMKKSLFVLLMISAGATLFAEGPVVTRYGYFAECPLAVDGGRELVSFPDDAIAQRLMRRVTIKPGNLYLIRITDAKEGDLDVWMWGDTARAGRVLYVIYRAQSFRTDDKARRNEAREMVRRENPSDGLLRGAVTPRSPGSPQ